MNKPKSNKVWYIVFISTVILTIVANELIVQYNLNLQLSDATVINTAGKQRMLSQKITKEILKQQLDNYDENTPVSLEDTILEFQEAHESLTRGALSNTNTPEIEAQFQELQPYYENIVNAALSLQTNLKDSLARESVVDVLQNEPFFLKRMNAIVTLYEENSNSTLKNTKQVVFILSCFSVLVLLGEFLFFIMPLFKKLKVVNQELSQNNRRLSDFAHISSHNLRAPLNNLKSLLEIYDMSTLDEEKEEIIRMLKHSTENLNETMRNLIDTLKVQNIGDDERHLIHLNEVLEKTKAALGQEIKETNATIEADFSQLQTVNYNAIYLESIFLNLVGNSIKYKSPERSPHIQISSKQVKGRPVLIFSDNGLGLDMEKKGSELFGMGKTFHKHPEAKGLGLFMTRTQIEAYGGKIVAESTVDEGITFTITL